MKNMKSIDENGAPNALPMLRDPPDQRPHQSLSGSVRCGGNGMPLTITISGEISANITIQSESA